MSVASTDSKSESRPETRPETRAEARSRAASERAGSPSNELKVFSGRNCHVLARRVCEHIAVEHARAYPQFRLGAAETHIFEDGELLVKLEDDVRGRDCFVIISTCAPVNENVMELLLFCDCLRRASARRITIVMPYYGYGRQDRKDVGRVPISAKLVANLIMAAKADRIVALDLHAAQIQGFFEIPVDHMFATPVFIDYFKPMVTADSVVVSPDAGGVERARAFAKRLDLPLAIIDKRRTDVNVAEVMHIIGDVRNKDCFVVDDLIDTAGTLVKGVEALVAEGAKSVRAVATHAVFSGPAIDRIQGSAITEVVVTDSIPLTNQAAKCGKIKVLSVAPLLARAIQSIHEDGSVSALFV